jgi:hypothetical protein
MGIAALLAQNSQALINLITANVSTVPLSGTNVTLTEAEYSSPVLEFTGTLTENVSVTTPSRGIWLVYNATSGPYTVTMTNGIGAVSQVVQNVLSDVASLGSAGVLISSGGASTGGVTSFNTRTGAVTLGSMDITNAGGALLLSPAFTGTPTSTTPAPGDDSTNIATTAFVDTALSSYAPLNSPTLTGVPTAPTQPNTSNNTDIATTAFVQNLVSAVAGGLNYQGTWNASTNTPTLTSGVGTKGYLYEVSVAGTTTLDGNSTWNVGDFVLFNGTVWQRIPAQTTGVASFNTRTGAVTLESTDVTTALGYTPANATTVAGLAPLASPAFTGTPTAPTPAPGANNTDVATTAFVATSYAPLANPALTGVPTAPTATTGTNTTQLATTAFVDATLNQYAPIANPAFTGRVQAPAYSFTTDPLGSVSGSVTLDMGAASEYSMTIAGNTTLAFTNTLGANRSEVVYLRFTNAGSATITWPTSTKFSNKTAPTFTASGVDLVGVTYDTITSTYMVFVIGLNVG